MTPEAFEDVHSFIQFSMLVQEKMGARFTEEDLENEIKKGETYLGIKFQEDEYNALKRRLESRFKIKHTLSSVIYNNYDDIPDWYSNFTPKDEFFWQRYRKHLITFEKLPLPSVNLLGEKTLVQLMNCLSNPNIDPVVPIFRRGLVIGDVQSGKTATYGGLICKAADAGYKAVILLTGTTESLRKQTQERMEEGIIGMTIRVDKKGTKQKTFNKVGVGLLDDEIRAIAYTSYQDDFVGGSDTLLTTLGSHKSLVLFIVKKNVTVLEKLRTWLVELNKSVQDGLIHVPLLLIDDEADNASINTKNDKSSPTKTNALIRQICTAFNNSTYVGFTATPFANVFIDPDTTEQMTSADLFPEHFIYVLPTPSNYIGAMKIFYPNGEYRSMLKFITDIDEPDVEELKEMEPEERFSRLLYYKHPKEWEGELPDSLTESIYCYMVANAVRDLRGDSKAPRTMMINVSRFVKVQKYLKRQVDDIVSEIHRAVDCDFYDDNSKNQNMPVYRRFVEVWNKHFKHLGLDQEFVINKKVLFNAIDKIQVIIVNSDKDSMKLDYKTYPSMRIIAIGGLALSRGLTLKGLMTSYFYRNTSTFDVLMQMGRWFGYRPNYEDLCHIWTSHTSARWYEEITKSTEELKDDIRQMFDEKMTPKEFGIKVRDESSELQITAYNKMRASFKRTEYLTFWGSLIETPYSSLIASNNAKNVAVVKTMVQRLYAAGYKATPSVETPDKYKTKVFSDVPVDFVSYLLSQIEVSKFNAKFNTKTILEFLGDNSGAKLSKWDISIQSGSGNEVIDYGHGVEVHNANRDMIVSNNHICFTGRGTLGGPTDGCVGITPEQRNDAKEAMKAAKRAAKEPLSKGTPNYTWFKYISERKPLLIVYSIKHSGNGTESKLSDYLSSIGNDPILGFAIGFPANGNADSTQKKYRVNKTFQRQVLEEEYEDPEEE